MPITATIGPLIKLNIEANTAKIPFPYILKCELPAYSKL